MDYIADLHVHSPFSRATSKECSPAGLFAWARIKGIQVTGTGDFTHAGWLQRLREDLIEAEYGFFRLRDEKVPLPWHRATAEPVRFILSAEISCIYKRHGAVRKVHNLVYVPDFASAERVNARLAKIGNILSDGRPILGIDSRDLLEIVLEESPEGFLVPAHIWTPWFSLFGSKSGFNRIEECFGDLTHHVFALETGLSSDPDMNRLISDLDRFALISNSDCHSPSRLGREANLFATGFDYISLREALRQTPEMSSEARSNFFPRKGNITWTVTGPVTSDSNRKKPARLKAFARSAKNRLPSASCTGSWNWRIGRNRSIPPPPRFSTTLFPFPRCWEKFWGSVRLQKRWKKHMDS